MIKIENGKINLEGNTVTLKSNLATIISSIREAFAECMSQDEADENIREAIRVGFMTEEELRDELKRVKRTEEKENEYED